ncbi:MAG TPA: cytochrome P450, partial [Acidimicrobiia bacterium]|nr:cytochrome P450 [Acidimicrobiia bacterium]
MFDPFDPGQAHDAWPMLARMRAEAPVVDIANGMRYVTRHAECRAVLRDPHSFSNATGMKAPGIEIPAEDRLLGELDPPRHTLVRRVMVTALSPKLVHATEPFMRATAGTLLDGITQSPADLVAAFTVPLPNRMTVHLLGFDPADAEQLAVWAKTLMESTFPATNRTARGEGFAGAFPEFAAYIDAHIDERAQQLAAGSAPDDVVARLLGLTDDGVELPRRQIRALVRNLITGGLTTTSQLLGNLLHELLANPALDGAVRADRDALRVAVEESLRLSPPVLFMARGCVQDVRVGGCPVSAGTRVIAGFASANRDEGVFDDSDTFRIDRPNAEQHLTFGYGPHVCPGASLARAVAYAGIDAFFDRFPEGSVRLAPGFEFENV